MLCLLGLGGQFAAFKRPLLLELVAIYEAGSSRIRVGSRASEFSNKGPIGLPQALPDASQSPDQVTVILGHSGGAKHRDPDGFAVLGERQEGYLLTQT